MAREIDHEWQRMSALQGLAPHLREGLFDAALIAEQSLEDEQLRAGVLSDLGVLARVIDTLGSGEAIAETFSAIQDTRRWRP